MKLTEILSEGVTFSVAKLELKDGEKWYVDPFQEKTMEKCWVCKGTGKEQFGGYTRDDGEEVPKTEYPCGMCKGKGENEEWRTSYNELNVSNSNAWAIQEMLGLKPDYGGAIKHADLPQFRRHLIKLKNGNVDQHTKAPTDDQGKMRVYKDDNGMSRIGKGARMMDMGRSHEQVMGYVDRLLTIIDFAQKNDCDLVWS